MAMGTNRILAEGRKGGKREVKSESNSKKGIELNFPFPPKKIRSPRRTK